MLAIGASLVFGLIAAEAGLRLYGFSAVVFERPDPITGTSMQPFAEGWQTIEGKALVSINSHGFRDRERPQIKPEGTMRIAVLGDSFVEARQVAFEEAFPSVLERLLARDSRFAGRKVEVLNFGVPGYGTGQELLTLQRDVFAFQPDQVILAVFTGNDIADNSKALSHPMDTRPYFTLNGDDLALDSSFLDSQVYKDRQRWLARSFYTVQAHSRLVQLAYRASRALNRSKAPDGAEPPSPFNQPGLPNNVYRPPINETWETAWRVTERLVARLEAECGQRGVGFSVVTLSNPPQVSPDTDRRRAFEEKLGVPDLFYPDRRIAELGERLGFPVLNLAPPLQRYAVERQVYLHGFPNIERGMGHWNAEAHRLAAELIAPWVSPRGAQPN